MLGERAARSAGDALVQDVCSRAKAHGLNLLDTPRDKLAALMTVGASSAAVLCLLVVCIDAVDARRVLKGAGKVLFRME